MTGKIIKGIGGFYYVHLADSNIYECKAKGIFRNRKIKPTIGDNVEIDIISQDDLTGNISMILDRSSLLVRPAVANVDQAVIIFSLTQPEPNYNLLDRFLIMMQMQGVETIICMNKSDICDENEANKIKDIYENCGYKVVIASAENSTGIEDLKAVIKDKTTVFAGPSGVGKSSLLNEISPRANVETGEISNKIKRGKHTTRHSELIHIEGDTYIMDTPGFSSLSIEGLEAEEVKNYYDEFIPFASECKFNGCIHINEPKCKVKEHLNKEISELRYSNYKQIYEEIKNTRRW